MQKKCLQLFSSVLVATMLSGVVVPLTTQAAVENGWEIVDGNYYWYENGVKQGTEGRGKEIYDPDSDAWYWLDAVDGGKKATAKDLYQESDAGEWAENADGTGKWVRYDENGHMVKGWYTNESGTYYFDQTYGTMAKGTVTIDGQNYIFDANTGILQENASVQNGWEVMDGNWYWYENGVKQGTEGRGKEIYDPDSDAWYWLDAVDGGRKATSKDLYQESEAGEWAENADGTGKWVRYDENGHMVKGWYTNESGTYYFDPTYGTMAKGIVTVEGNQYEFDAVTGIFRGEISSNTSLKWLQVKKSYFDEETNLEYYYLYEYHTNGNIKIEKKYNADDILECTNEYNEEGYIVNEVIYGTNGNVESSMRYSYDASKPNYAEGTNQSGNVTYCCWYRYDNVTGLLLEKEEVEGSNLEAKNNGQNYNSTIWKYEYDEQGNTTRELMCGCLHAGFFTRISQDVGYYYTYELINGQYVVTEETCRSSDEEYRKTYEYNESGMLVKESYYNSLSAFYPKTYIAYDTIPFPGMSVGQTDAKLNIVYQWRLIYDSVIGSYLAEYECVRCVE